MQNIICMHVNLLIDSFYLGCMNSFTLIMLIRLEQICWAMSQAWYGVMLYFTLCFTCFLSLISFR
jgi:hypothetical protein